MDRIFEIIFSETSGYGKRFIIADTQTEVLDILRLAEYPNPEDLQIYELNSSIQIWDYLKDEFKIERETVLNAENYIDLLGDKNGIH